jgi:hypothetical protein
MPTNSSEPEPRPAEKSRTKYILIAGAVLAVALGVAWLCLVYVGSGKVADLGGGLAIQADPDARIVIGARPLGPAQAYVSWSDLLADRDANPMAIERGPADGPITAETLAGSGAKVLHTSSGGGGGTNNLNVDSAEWLLRRPDGTLDQLWTITLDWTAASGKLRRILVPVRIRAAKGAPPAYYVNNGSSSSVSSGLALLKFFGRPPTTADESWRFTAGNPPADLEQEIITKGLWEPAPKD